jgi:hypothetical protein
VPTSEILNGKVTQLAAKGLQDVFIASGCGGSDLVARLQPVRARLLHRQRGWLHVGAGINLALDLRQRLAGFFLGPVAAAQLFALPVSGSRANGKLLTHDTLAAGAAT